MEVQGEMQVRMGKVFLVGAGPGSPDLISVRGLSCLRRAQVVVYDRLTSRSLLAETAPDCERIYVGKQGHGCHAMSQEAISQLLVDRARAGLTVCRLKGGDPFVFGRGGEEAERLSRAGVPFEVVPGVTAGTAAAAYAGIPVTHRGLATAVTFATGHEGAASSAIDWNALAAGSDTLVFYMGLGRLAQVRDELVRRGRPAETPAAVVHWGACPEQRVATGRLGDLPQWAGSIPQPAVIVIGEVAALRERLAWAERLPLFGCRVLLPASGEVEDDLADAVRDAGGEPWLFPRRPGGPHPHEIELLRSELTEGRIHLGAVTSPHGVHRLFCALDAAVLRRVPFRATTPEAMAALAEYGVSPVPSNAFLGETVW